MNRRSLFSHVLYLVFFHCFELSADAHQGAISAAWRFITDPAIGLGLPTERLRVSVLDGDAATAAIWAKVRRLRHWFSTGFSFSSTNKKRSIFRGSSESDIFTVFTNNLEVLVIGANYVSPLLGRI